MTTPIPRTRAMCAADLNAVVDWWQTDIVDIEPGVIRLRGYPVEQLIGRVSFPAMIWLMLRGELPESRHADLFGAVLVAAVDHGPQAPSIATARMAATCGVGINNAMASGVNALGDVHGGAGEQCMRLLARVIDGQDKGEEAAFAVRRELDAWRTEHGRFIPGFGHRFHHVDPRAVRLAELVDEAHAADRVSGKYLAAAREVERSLSSSGRSVPMNIDGIAAVVLLELGFPWELGRGVFILSRSVGICAHAFEQTLQGGRIKGPTPPAVGFRYTGPGPRSLPEEGSTS
ncbi:citryl-CoA lyase [Streptomyces iranensis]|uniref:citrate synthase (unknown stereospecificity) n=2 Tax=Streptomyces iranensis TaxID=576784 RepID=A0ABS4N2A7_9ACTN|nr:citryl-CoA lyase [Streptomyces iranensis]MBP2066149.1 citrate synthase [Streptomyces iranensis]